MAVVIGDDQEEVFLDDNMPALSIYWGETAVLAPILTAAPATRLPGLAIAHWGYYPPEPPPCPASHGWGTTLSRR